MAGWFSLEAVYAKKGDAMILHYGPKKMPHWILIDGGHNGVYKEFLRPRLDEIALSWPQRLTRKNRLPLEMVMVSHADEDHLAGILDLTANLRNEDNGVPKAPVVTDSIWFNGFEDLIANTPEGASVMERLARTASLDRRDGLPIPTELHEDRDLRAVVASTAQGRQLLDDARVLEIQINKQFDSKPVMRGGPHKSVTHHEPGLTFTVLGPDKNRIDRLRERWKKDLQKILAKEESAADAASFSDASPFNLSSIIVLAEFDGKTMLLTGDARGDDLIKGLKEEGLLQGGKIEVDLFKLPHHGSDRNVKEETFEAITARKYVISANGEHDNPDPDTLDMLVAGRKKTRTDDFSLYLTFPEEAFKQISDERAAKSAKVRKQRDALEAVDRWLKTKRPKNMEVKYRESARPSLAVDLGTEGVFA
jgi:hypothetical protein